MVSKQHVSIVEYYWGGHKGPFRIKTVCAECDLTKEVILQVIKKDLKGYDVAFEQKPWLDNVFHCLFRGGWHAPIVMINGRVVSQGVVPKRQNILDVIKAGYSKLSK